MIYQPGQYLILLFNELGAKHKTKKAPSYLLALAKQRKFLKKHPTCSSTILLVMNNSRKCTDKWGIDRESRRNTKTE